MPLINSILSWLNYKRLYQMDLFKKHPCDAQQEVLFKLLHAARNTEWGKKYDFSSIKDIDTFQKRLPIQDYESIKPEIERLMRGEEDIIWPGNIKWFAKSSGTTSDKSKFIPVSKETMEENHFRGGRDIFALYMANFPDSPIFKGKGLTLGGSHQINRLNNQSFYGDLSAILIENVPFWTHFVRTPSQKIALMDEWEQKLEEITRTTIKENVTNLMGVPSWNLVLIKHILDYTGKNNLLEVWPNLELFIHGGVKFDPYRKQFEKLIPSDKMNYFETYNASEGFFAIQDEAGRDDMLLLLDAGIFFEFIPAHQVDTPSPLVYSIRDVKTEENYAMLISTNSGLWRYQIGDTVTFTSTYPHRIRISGRTKHFINAFGEEIIIDNAEKALNEACNATGASVNEYTVAPVFMTDCRKGSHEWLIEFNNAPSNHEKFLDQLDKNLQNINSDYEAKRYKNITLEKPQLKIAPSGTFFKWLEQKGKLGGQNKVPRLYNNRKYIDELIGLIQ